MSVKEFRAWDKEAKCYIKDPVLVDNFGNVYVVCKESSNKKGTCLITGKPNVILERNTGLKDKNGKEIHEGDIVDYNDDGDCIGYVVYNAPNFEIMERTGFPCWLKGGPHQRVIGNIHKNPELLEREDAKG